MKLVRDPIHGFIEIDEDKIEIVSNPLFQRLRFISQTGLASHVYPGMTHTRFEHSLGVMKASSEIVKRVGENSGLDFVSKGFVNLVSSVGMLHDIGHLPFSHTFELGLEMANKVYGLRLEDNGRKTHVHIGLRVIEEEFAKNLEKISKETNISDPVKFTKDALLDVPKSEEERLCSYIISSSIDADRSDYLLRDSYYAGVVYGLFDLERLKRILVYRDGKLQVLEKGVPIAEEFLLGRTHMYQNVYFHSVVGMFNAILALALAKMFKDGELSLPNKSEELLDMTDFRILTEVGKKGGYAHDAILFRKGFKRAKDLELNGECARMFYQVRKEAIDIMRDSDGMVVFHEFSDAPDQDPLNLFVYTKEGPKEMKTVSKVAGALGRIDKVVLAFHETANSSMVDRARSLLEWLKSTC
ncbi:phosphohydrolase [Sulfodiicoccus acidiphilus]|nr:HD domain-containing protein [Sulfodiicoccus acidiphilus]GGU02353.1 phosphohydrolase [Sulfodiicoccus acidiphilus]